MRKSLRIPRKLKKACKNNPQLSRWKSVQQLNKAHKKDLNKLLSRKW